MLKNNQLKSISLVFFLVTAVACSTKKNSFVSRNWHALNARDNTMYNGSLALDAGINEVKGEYHDNFWEILPVERMQIPEEALLPGQKEKNKNFERAETKATKAIQKHSMNIEGKEKNYQMDEAHLMLGKARYYDQRFIPALEAFNYILYKHTNSDKINEAKVWREKTNIRLENDALAVKNLKRLINKSNLKQQVFADANAILAQAFINLEYKDSAIAPLKKAITSTKLKEERARYHFILGQLYQSLDYKDSAYNEFQEVIDMKRKSPRQYVIRAHAKQALLSDPTKDTLAFVEKYKKLLKDRENRQHLDVLNFEMALFYDKLGNKQNAIKYYNKSLKKGSNDSYLQASTYRNLATIYFDKAKYITAGKYYDSTLTKLVKKNREYYVIAKKKENLVDVIKYEGIVSHNDSILQLTSMSSIERVAYFEKHIANLKAKDSTKKALETKQKELANQQGIQDIGKPIMSPPGMNETLLPPGKADMMQLPKGQQDGAFYFYTPTTVAYGKVEFQKRWGKRVLIENWRWLQQKENVVVEDNQETKPEETKPEVVEEKYSTNFYISQLPTSQFVLDSLAKERNFANYQLGVIYKEKFSEQKLAASKFETVLKSQPEERLILPSLYNLYKIYELSDKTRAEEIKNQIISQYPNTRYAQILNGNIPAEDLSNESPESVYKKTYEKFTKQEYVEALQTIDKSVQQFAGDDLIPKFELLKASVLGKLKGLSEYKKAVSYVAVTYPDSDEAKQAEDILKVSIPRMEQRILTQDTVSTNWKLLYKVGKKDDTETVKLTEKLEKYFAEKQYDKFKVSYDVYDETTSFVVVHGISSRDFARYLITLLKEDKKYKVLNPAQVISSDNYLVIQIHKNYNQFLELKM